MVKEEACGIASDKPLFIVELDKKKNQIVLGEEKDLYKTELIANNFNFQVDIDKILKMDNVTAKIRYTSKSAKVLSIGTVLFDTVKNEKVENSFCQTSSEAYRIVFEEPQRAITKGQSVVLYKDNVLLGGGIIS